MSYLALSLLQPQTFIFSSNSDALVVQTVQDESKIALINATGSNTLNPVFYLSANRDVFQIQKNTNTIGTFAHENNQGYLTIDNVNTERISFSNTFTVEKNNQPIITAIYENNQAKLGIGSTSPTYALDVVGHIYTTGTLYASNITVYGETIIIDAVTSNSEQVYITNAGSGPALKVIQTGTEPIAEFYDDTNLSLLIADGGLIGFHTSIATQPVDIYGTTIINGGNVGIGLTQPAAALDILGDLQLSGKILLNGSNYFETLSQWKYQGATSNIYFNTGYVGIGTNNPTQELTVQSNILVHNQFISSTTNQPPFVINSTQRVDNLNVQYLDGYDRTYYQNIENLPQGVLRVSQGGLGSNNLTANKLLVSNSNTVLTPHELHWDGQRLGIQTTLPQETLHIGGNLQLENTIPYILLTANQKNNVAKITLSNQLNITTLCNEPVLLNIGTQTKVNITSNLTSINTHLFTNGNVGIGTTTVIPDVALAVYTTDAIKIPTGTLLQRPTPQTGYIRYNIDTLRFEGYASNQWESLNKLESVSFESKITPELYPGANDNTLRFYTSSQLQATLNQDGNLGIGTTLAPTKLAIYSTDAILIPAGTTQERPQGIEGMIRFNKTTHLFEAYGVDSSWSIISGLTSADKLTSITAELTPGNNDSNIRFYTSGTQQAIIDLQGNVGIGSATPQFKLDVAGSLNAQAVNTVNVTTSNLSTSNFTVLQNFYYAPDGASVRNSYQINPTQYTQVITQPTSNFTVTVDGIYAASPQKTHVFINGSKLAYYSPTEKDYDINFINTPTQTIVYVSLMRNVDIYDIVDIFVYPSYLDPNGTLLPGYVLQNLTYTYWRKLNSSSNIFYTSGNVGVGTTNPNSTFHVEGTSLFYGNVGVGTNISQNISGLYVTNGPIRALGPVVESLTNQHRIDLGVLNNTPRQVFENKDATTNQIYQIDVENESGSGVFRWYIPGTTLMQLSPTANRIYPNTFIGSASTYPVNTLDILNNMALGSYAGVNTAPANTLIVSGNIGIGTIYPVQKLQVSGHTYLAGNLGIGTSIPTHPLHVVGNSYFVNNIGIGTTFAKESLDVQNNIYMTGNIGFGKQPTVPIDIFVRRATDSIDKAIIITTATNDISETAITGTAIDMKMVEDSGPLALTTLARIAYGNRQGTDFYGAGYENNGVLMFDTASAGTLNTVMLLTGKGYVGIGTTIPRQKLEVTSGNAIISGNVGINTTIPNYALHVVGNASISDNLILGNLGLGTTLPQTRLDVRGNTYLFGNVGINTSNISQNQLTVQGTQVISDKLGIGTTTAAEAIDIYGIALFSSNVGIGTRITNHILTVQGNAYISGNVGIGTTIIRSGLDIDKNTLIAGNIGIGTTLPQQSLHVVENATINKIGIGTFIPRERLDIIGNTIQQGNVGINTTTPLYPLHIHSDENVMTVYNGKLGIAKAFFAASTDIEIRNSSNTYTGILIKNNGNLNPTASLRIQAQRYDNNLSPSYAASIGLTRYNNNTYQLNNAPLGGIHFGGNHTNNSVNTIAYAASIQAIAEADFVTSSNVNIGLAFYTGSNSYQYIDTNYLNPQEVLRLTSSAKVGIRTSTPTAILEINGSNIEDIPLSIYSTKAILLPVGSNQDRPLVPKVGYIRYNTEYQQFEGYGPGNTWGSLGGIRSVSGDTYILPEYSPGNNDQALHFYTASIEQAILNNNGNLGIGTLTPTQKLHVQGNIYAAGTLYASNLEVFGDSIIINAVTSNSEQVVIRNTGTGPALKVTQTGDNPIAEFYDGDFPSSQVAMILANNGYVGINTYNPRERLDIIGNTIVQGNIGIGTTITNYGLHVYDKVSLGAGLKQEGPYFIQEKWDSIGNTHIISYPKYCVADNSCGTLKIHVKSSTQKIGNISLSYLKQPSSNVDIFSIYYHKTNNLNTLTVSADTSNIKVLTDTDCQVSWTSIGAC